MWKKIKNILSKDGGKCIVVEDNQPSYLVMKLEDYEKMSQNDSLEVAEVNRNVDHWKAEEKTEEKTEEKIDGEDVKVEDLPF